VLADRYEGKRLSGPNDVVVKSDGAVYFTDSVNGLRGGANGPLRELPFNGVYRVKDGVITLLDSDKNRPGEFPNDIAFSPDEKYLYVTAGFGKTLRWDVQPDGSIANPRTFIPAGNDGLKVDSKGNLYAVNAVGPGEVWITSPEGKHLGTTPTAADFGRASVADLRDQSRLRRRGPQGSLYHRLHAPVQGKAEGRGSIVERKSGQATLSTPTLAGEIGSLLEGTE